jgi:hypothetical protein
MSRPPFCGSGFTFFGGIMKGIAQAMRRVITGSTLACLAVSAQAGGALDLSLADDAVRVAYDATQAGSGLHINLSALHHMDDGNMLGAGVHVVDLRKPHSNLYIGLGTKAFAFDTDDYSGAALGVGGFFRAALPTQPDVSVAGYAYYAPPVVSFGDAENLISSDLRAQYAVIPTARIYTGYRYNGIRMEGMDKRYKLGDGWHFGLTLDF